MTTSWREVARFRAELYCFLGHCLLEPIEENRAALLQPSFWREFPLATANDTMRAALVALGDVTAKLAALAPEEALRRVQLEYAVLFLGTGERTALPWESFYRTEERLLFGLPALQVREIMARFGVEVAAKYRQPEDHLGLELMLLAAAGETDAGRDDWRESAGCQAAFIAEHPLAWIAALERDATVNATTGFYGAIVGLTHGVLLWDRELLDEYAAGEQS